MIPLRRVQNTGEKYRLLDIRWKKKFISVINPFFWTEFEISFLVLERKNCLNYFDENNFAEKFETTNRNEMKWNEMFNFLRSKGEK